MVGVGVAVVVAVGVAVWGAVAVVVGVGVAVVGAVVVWVGVAVVVGVGVAVVVVVAVGVVNDNNGWIIKGAEWIDRNPVLSIACLLGGFAAILLAIRLFFEWCGT